MKKNKDHLADSKQGSGSAENKGQERNKQVHPKTGLSQAEKQDIANAIGEDASSVSGLQDLGARSGRDDAAGGSGDRMENEQTGKATDR